MTSNTLHMFKPLAKFHADINFIYIIACRDEHKEEIQSYYKITEEDMEEITKEWPAEFLVPVDQVELSDVDLIGSPMVTRKEYDAPSSSKRKNKEEVQKLNSASKETTPESPGGGPDDEVDQEENEEKEEKLEQGEVTPRKDPLDEVASYKKRKVSPMKPSSWKKSKSSKPKL
jgi:hypothetical protein